MARTTINTVGIREELFDLVSNVDPIATPFQAQVADRNVQATSYDWQDVQLPTVDGANTSVEGAVINAGSGLQTRRLTNFIQLAKKDYQVSFETEDVNTAGRASEIASQAVWAIQALKRDVEQGLLSARNGRIGTGSEGPLTAGLGAWLRSNTNTGTGGADADISTSTGHPSSGRTDASSTRAFTETLFKNVLLQLANTSDMSPMGTQAFMSPSQMQRASAFAGNAERRATASQGMPEIVEGATMYLSSFGPVTFVTSKFQRPRDVFLVNPDFCEVAYLTGSKFVQTELAMTGRRYSYVIAANFGLIVKNERSCGMIADLTA